MSVIGQAPMTACALAGCDNRATVTISACGIFHLCDDCRSLIDELASQYAGGEG